MRHLPAACCLLLAIGTGFHVSSVLWAQTGTAPQPDSPVAAATQSVSIAPVAYPKAELLSDAGKLRLQAERKAMAQELLDNALWDPEKIQKAVDAMNAGAKDTVQDNVERFAAALASLHEKFADAYALYRADKVADATEAFNKLLFEKVVLIKAKRKHNVLPPYAYALAKGIYAELVARQGNASDAIIAYQIVVEKVPDSLTFAATARMRAALIYEQTRRGHFAVPVCRSLLEKSGRFLSDAENQRLAAHIAELDKNDPFLLARQHAHAASDALVAGDTGKAAQDAQKQLMAALNDMLIIAEEEDRPFLEHTEAVSQGAESGKLQGGSSGRMSPIGEDPSKGGSDDWGQLRPRDKQQLLEVFKATYPERYQEMLEAYYRNLSNAENARKE